MVSGEVVVSGEAVSSSGVGSKIMVLGGRKVKRVPGRKANSG